MTNVQHKAHEDMKWKTPFHGLTGLSDTIKIYPAKICVDCGGEFFKSQKKRCIECFDKWFKK